jgi:hypothetical protein
MSWVEYLMKKNQQHKQNVRSVDEKFGSEEVVNSEELPKINPHTVEDEYDSDTDYEHHNDLIKNIKDYYKQGKMSKEDAIKEIKKIMYNWSNYTVQMPHNVTGPMVIYGGGGSSSSSEKTPTPAPTPKPKATPFKGS